MLKPLVGTDNTDSDNHKYGSLRYLCLGAYAWADNNICETHAYGRLKYPSFGIDAGVGKQYFLV